MRKEAATLSLPLCFYYESSLYLCATTEETLNPLLPVNSSQQEYCVTSNGNILLAGDSWKANACSSCTCNNGTIQCFSQRCPAANCRVPVLRKGQCCPQCIGEYQFIEWAKVAFRFSFEYFYCTKNKQKIGFMQAKCGLYCILKCG